MEYFTVGIVGAVGTLTIGALVWTVRAIRGGRRRARSGSAPLTVDDARREQLRRAAATDYQLRLNQGRGNGRPRR